MKSFFVKSEKQKEQIEQALDSFGSHEVSYLDALVGGRIPTGDHYPYAESTFVRIIIPPNV